jgi:ParB/RepB/Spo0J family partition protein
MGEYQHIATERLFESPHNPRKWLDPTFAAELKASVRQHGVMTPLIVRPQGERFEVLAGANRLRAAVAIGLKEIPCAVRELDDVAALEFMILDNQNRTNPHPLDEGEGYRALMEMAGYTAREVAARIAKSEQYIGQRLKLTALVPEAKTEFLAGHLTAGHAILIARMPPEAQREILNTCVVSEIPLTIKELSAVIVLKFQCDLSTAPFLIDDASLPGGSCLECPKRSGADPELFPELGPNICTDAACFRAKSGTRPKLSQRQKRKRREALLSSIMERAVGVDRAAIETVIDALSGYAPLGPVFRRHGWERCHRHPAKDLAERMVSLSDGELWMLMLEMALSRCDVKAAAKRFGVVGKRPAETGAVAS